LVDPSGLDYQSTPCGINANGDSVFCVTTGDGGDGGDILCWWCTEYGGSSGSECWWCKVPPGSSPGGGSGSTVSALGPSRLALLSAPNNDPGSCVRGVLAENAVSLGLDFLGTLPIPEAGGITRLVGQELGAAKIGAIYRGVVADQQGTKFLNGLKNTTSAGALSGNASDTSGLGLASTAVGGAALTAGYFVPVLGQILSGGQLLIDSIHTYNTIQTKCYGHS
jgi:hypothetical protein